MDTAGKTIVITGANRGIGRALLEEALRRGCRRVYAGTRSEWKHDDPRVTAVRLDVTEPEQVRQFAERLDTVDVLINNAGIALYDDLSDPDVLRQHLDVNLFGALRVTRALLPQLRATRGAVVNNVSLVALAPVPIIPSYSVSKAAALNLTQSLRMLLADKGVTVHAVLLGPVDTDMNRGLDIPKADPAAVAVALFDGLAAGDEDIFPDPASQSLADGWRNGVAKSLEGQFVAFAGGQ